MTSNRSTSTTQWNALLAGVRGVFSAPGFSCFQALLLGWVLAPGRRTITAMIVAGDPEGARSHDTYHRFVRCAKWSLHELWRPLVLVMVHTFAPDGPVPVLIDDTLFKKTGRKMQGTGIFRDAVRSTRSKVVYALGLNLVVATLRVGPPWGGCPIGLPIAVRLHRKGGPSTVELCVDLCRELATWLPERTFEICADGAYATLIGRGLERTTVTSRMRRDAALFEEAPPKTHRAGRPRQRGAQLETPDAMSKRLGDEAFALVEYDCRGRHVNALVWSKRVLWYRVDKTRLVTLVIVRDPEGTCPDDFFVSDDAEATEAEIVTRYSGRWAIEVTFREVKQCVGAEDPQSWKHAGPERAANLSLWLYSAIWTWYIITFANQPTWTLRPWYPKKTTPSFLDALAALRRTLWTERIKPLSFDSRDHAKIIDGMLDILANAA